ncbi:MAG: hypothetical protein COB12_10615 [Flavobacterium sp.]|nr:MAG: hypothetical protein COB12_10615 [Flavobacterium sp.]
MKTSTLLKSVIVIGFLLFNTVISAQSKATKKARKAIESEKEQFHKFINNPKTIKKATKEIGSVVSSYERKQNLKKGYCTAEDYKLPKKVLLLSFYIKDNDYAVYSSSGDFFVTTTYKASGKKVNVVAQRIYEQSIEQMKKEYAALGMELITPFEFIAPIDPSTGKRVIDEKLFEAYMDYPLPILESKASKWGLGGDYSAVAKSFRFLPYSSVLGFQGKHFFKEKEDYLNNLGMDAYAIVVIDLTATIGALKGVSTGFIFKNPGYDASGAKGPAVGYTKYTGGTVSIPFNPPMKGIFIKEEKEITTKKGKQDIKFVTVDVDAGVSALLNHLTKKLVLNTKNQIVGSKKKK